MKHIKFILSALILIVSLTVLIKIFFIQIYTVQTDSMYKTILPGNKVIINKLSRLRTDDIVLYKDDLNDQLKLSRIVAEYGDTVSAIGQDIMVNDREAVFKEMTRSYCLRYIRSFEADILAEKYKLIKTDNSGTYQIELSEAEYDKIINDSNSYLRSRIFELETCTHRIFSLKPEKIMTFISKDSFYILNDRRNDLYDSRSFGTIAKKNIVGKLIYSF